MLAATRMGAVAYTNAKPSILKSHSWNNLSRTSLEIQYSFSCHDHINFTVTFTLPHPQPFQWLTSSAVSSRTSEVALASHRKPSNGDQSRHWMDRTLTEKWTNLQILVHWQTHLSHVSRPQYLLPRSLKRSCHFLLSYQSAGQKTAVEAW